MAGAQADWLEWALGQDHSHAGGARARELPVTLCPGLVPVPQQGTAPSKDLPTCLSSQGPHLPDPWLQVARPRGRQVLDQLKGQSPGMC